MRNVKCKQCGCDIYHEYSPIESLNDKRGREKVLVELKQYPDEKCHTAIYLKCDNGHLCKYYCTIETK